MEVIAIGSIINRFIGIRARGSKPDPLIILSCVCSGGWLFFSGVQPPTLSTGDIKHYPALFVIGLPQLIVSCTRNFAADIQEIYQTSPTEKCGKNPQNYLAQSCTFVCPTALTRALNIALRLSVFLLTTCGLQTCFCTSLSLNCKPVLIVLLM